MGGGGGGFGAGGRGGCGCGVSASKSWTRSVEVDDGASPIGRRWSEGGQAARASHQDEGRRESFERRRGRRLCSYAVRVYMEIQFVHVRRIPATAVAGRAAPPAGGLLADVCCFSEWLCAPPARDRLPSLAPAVPARPPLHPPIVTLSHCALRIAPQTLPHCAPVVSRAHRWRRAQACPSRRIVPAAKTATQLTCTLLRS